MPLAPRGVELESPRRFPDMPSFRRVAPVAGAGTGSYVLVALAGGLLVLGGGALALTVAELRREPA